MSERGESLESFQKRGMFGDPRPRGAAPITLLPSPPATRRRYAIVSVDDHLLEPPDMFVGRVPAAIADEAPRVVEDESGGQHWLIDGEKRLISMGNAMVGRPRDEWSVWPVRFEEVIRGAWDVQSRIQDMDIAGVWASLGFPSIPWGFAGQSFSKMTNPQVGLACLRAYNDWLVEDWTSAFPDRLIPSQLPWLADVDTAVEEILRNAARGVHAVSFTENPDMLGYPSIHSGYWDPFFAACAETGTVVNLHVGSASWTPVPSADAPGECLGTLFAVTSLVAATDWLWSQVPLRFPNLRVAFSEGGLGWLPLLLDKIEYMEGKYLDLFHNWPSSGPSPTEVVRRNFRFCSLYDPLGWGVLERVGAETIMVEVDYPHVDSTWPDSQEVLHRQIGNLSPDVVRQVTYENACALYQHPLPPTAWAEQMGTIEHVAGIR